METQPRSVGEINEELSHLERVKIAAATLALIGIAALAGETVGAIEAPSIAVRIGFIVTTVPTGIGTMLSTILSLDNSNVATGVVKEAESQGLEVSKGIRRSIDERQLQLFADKEWFLDNLPSLMREYPDEYLAVHKGVILAHNVDLDVIANTVYAENDQRPLLIKKVEEQHDIPLPGIALAQSS